MEQKKKFWVVNGIILIVISTLVGVASAINSYWAALIISLFTMIVGIHIYGQNMDW